MQSQEVLSAWLSARSTWTSAQRTWVEGSLIPNHVVYLDRVVLSKYCHHDAVWLHGHPWFRTIERLQNPPPSTVVDDINRHPNPTMSSRISSDTLVASGHSACVLLSCLCSSSRPGSRVPRSWNAMASRTVRLRLMEAASLTSPPA